MTRSLILVSVLAAGLAPVGVAAVERGSPDRMPEHRPEPAGILLAQEGDIEVYYDRMGRRVIVDAWTGEVIAIEPTRRSERRAYGEAPPPDDRYYLEGPDDAARRRDERLYELGRRPQPPQEVYPEYEEPFPEYRPLPEDNWQQAYPEYPEGQDRYVERGPVERRPLPGPGAPTAPGDTIIEQTVPPAAIEPPVTSAAREEVAELQVLLDRMGASPGVIDGRFGSNVDKALAAYNELTGKALRTTDREAIKAALAESGGEPFIEYTITASDAAGPYVASVPEDYGEKAKLERLSYTSVAEMLAERFHMDEKYLRALNPDANFNRPGTIIRVANVGGAVKTPVIRIVADKRQKQVRAYSEDGSLIAAYPATIGSSDTPSPSGTHTVERIALNPEYTYNPKINFKQGNNHDILKIPPGPNGPVGSVWIALSKPTYGIHGTPDPSKIGKTESHGCVRLTNWDAEELAKVVKKGVTVEFLD